MILLRAQNILFKPLTLSGRTLAAASSGRYELRQQTILQLVNDRRRISVTEFARLGRLGSHHPARSQPAGKRSYLKRVHGSAVALESDDVDARMMSNFTLKQRLAQYAAAQVNDGETIFIESGSANASAGALHRRTQAHYVDHRRHYTPTCSKKPTAM